MRRTSSILKDAKLRVEQGWCKNKSVEKRLDGGINYCMYGAIAVEQGRITKAIDAIHLHVPSGGVCTFNDAKSRRKSEVLNIFDWAIGYCRSNGD